jgi:hypothetical protein
MGIETSQFHRRHDKALRRSGQKLEELYDKLCPVDAGLVGEDGRCSTCARQIREPKPAFDFVPEPGMSSEQIEAQTAFWARVESQRREREQQEAAAATKKKTPPEHQGRDYSRYFDSAGNVRR